MKKKCYQHRFFSCDHQSLIAACGKLESVNLARCAVQVGLEYEIDVEEEPLSFDVDFDAIGYKAPG